jgi:hypothetical protein
MDNKDTRRRFATLSTAHLADASTANYRELALVIGANSVRLYL